MISKVCTIKGIQNQENGHVEIPLHVLMTLNERFLIEEEFKNFSNPFSKTNVEMTTTKPDEKIAKEEIKEIITPFISNPAAYFMKQNVTFLFRECRLNEKYPWKNPNCIIGEAPCFDICYDKEKIAKRKKEIEALLGQLKSLETYQDLAFLASGERWTILQQEINLLLSLANAAEILEFDRNDLLEENKNPRLMLKPKSDTLTM